MSSFINWLHEIAGTQGHQNIEIRWSTAASNTTRTLWTATGPGTKQNAKFKVKYMRNEKMWSEMEGKLFEGNWKIWSKMKTMYFLFHLETSEAKNFMHTKWKKTEKIVWYFRLNTQKGSETVPFFVIKLSSVYWRFSHRKFNFFTSFSFSWLLANK